MPTAAYRPLFSRTPLETSERRIRQLMEQFLKAGDDCQASAFLGLSLAVFLVVLTDDESTHWEAIARNHQDLLQRTLLKLYRCHFIDEELLWRLIDRWLVVTEEIPLAFLESLRNDLPAYELTLLEEVIQYQQRMQALRETQAYNDGTQKHQGRTSHNGRRNEYEEQESHVDFETALETFSEDKLLLLLQSSPDLGQNEVKRVVDRLQTDRALAHAEKLCERRWPEVAEHVRERRAEVQAQMRTLWLQSWNAITTESLELAAEETLVATQSAQTKNTETGKVQTTEMPYYEQDAAEQSYERSQQQRR